MQRTRNAVLPAVTAVMLLMSGACSTKPPFSVVPIPAVTSGYLAVLNGNGGSLSFCFPDSGTVSTGSSVGADYPQSVKVLGSFLVVVNSDGNNLKVYDARDPAILLKTVQFDPGLNPVEIVFDASGIGYVSCYNASRILKVDVDTGSVLGSLDIPPAQGANPDGSAVADGKLYVGLTGFGSGNTVGVVDLASFSFAASSPVAVGENPQSLVKAGGLVHAVCTSGYNPDWSPKMQGSVHIIDPATDSVTCTVDLAGSDPAYAAAAGNGRVFVSGWEAGLMCYEAGTGTVLRGPANPIARPPSGGLQGLAVVGPRVYVCSFMTDELLAFDADTFAPAGSFAVGSQPSAVASVP